MVEFPGTKLTGEIAPIIKDYADRGLIKVMDLLFLTKDQDGRLEAFEASDLGESEIGELRGYERDLRWCSASRRSSRAARPPYSSGRTCGPRRSARRCGTPGAS